MQTGIKTIDNTINQRFGKLVVLKERPDLKGKGRMVECICDCGITRICPLRALGKDNYKSCGCDRVYHKTITHGMTLSSEYNTWTCMKDRCYSPNNPSYLRYGSNGITVCDEWKNSFETFYKDMGPKPSPEHTIDRRDGTKGYYKENCRWATKREQSNNLSSNVYHEYMGKQQTLSQWSDELGFDYQLIRNRICKGKITLEQALALGIPLVPLYMYQGKQVRLANWCKELKINYQWAFKQIKLYNATLDNIVKLASINKNTQYTIAGITKTISGWCFHTKTNPRVLIYRLLDNWTIEEALQPIEKKLISFSIDNTGKPPDTLTLDEWCGLLGLDRNTTYLRILRGESFESIVAE